MFRFTEKTHVHTMWFVTCPKVGCDILGALYRDGDGPWEARYRFRYDADNRRNQYSLLTEGKPFDQILTALIYLMEHSAAMTGWQVYTVEVDGGWEKVLSLLSEQPWFVLQKEGMAQA
jgi:hypothetical protein